MSFKLNNIYEVFGHNAEFSNGDRIVNEVKLPKKVLGQINPNGVIEINKQCNSFTKKKSSYARNTSFRTNTKRYFTF